MKPIYSLKKTIATMAAISALIVVGNNGYAASRFLVIHHGQLVENETGSYDCLACHDGMTAKEVGFQNRSHRSSSNPLGSHPIEVQYPSEWSGNRNFAPPAKIGQSGLRLLDGKVSCITCHDLRLFKREYYLPVTMKGSALCFVCHQV